MMKKKLKRNSIATKMSFGLVILIGGDIYYHISDEVKIT